MKEIRNDVNFRVKVDLSQFYNDKRKLSYVYIDKNKITNVLHLQTKIQNIFGITQPLYLVVNDVFLPVNEDIRIVKEDEVVVVQSLCPDSNKTSTVSNTVFQTSENNSRNEVIESLSQCEIYGSDSTDLDMSYIAKPNVSADDNPIDETNIMECEIARDERRRIPRNGKNNQDKAVQSLCQDSNKSSTVSNTVFQIPENNSRNKGSPSQREVYGSDSTNLELSYMAKDNGSANGDQMVETHTVGSEIPRKKRKRVRRKKNKNIKDEESSLLSNFIQQNAVASTNHQIQKVDIDVPNPKHLKFFSGESDSTDIQSNGIGKNSLHSKPIVRSTEVINLDTLLGLRKTEVPLTFSGHRRTRTSSVTSSFSQKSSNNRNPTKMDVSPTSTSGSSTHSTVDYSKINISEYPIHTGTFELGDIIAFQTLILNELYCPVLSDFIVAKISTIHLSSHNYSCKILMGFDQLKTPDGKFTLPVDDEEEDLNEKNIDDQEFVIFKHSDLYQPRLIFRPT